MLTFHPAVRRWFDARFPEGPSEVQARGWAEIQAGRHTLIAAPTGSGKTLAAFLAAIDGLVRRGLGLSPEGGELRDETTVLYISPLKALGNDIQKNLAEPLLGIADAAFELGQSLPRIRTAVRSGDTKASERASIVKKPPHLLITTPESLYLLLTSEKGREVLRTVRTVIIDEIHALADDKRGSHLSLSIERLEALTQRPLQRIGLSATQHPIEEIARFLVGSGHVRPDGTPDCAIVDASRPRKLDLQIEIPKSELGAVPPKEVWAETYDRLADLIREHRTTLVFVNTRRLVERVAFALQERLGADQVAAHHGSLSRARRLEAEQKLKNAEVKAAVATASLELGVDLGAVELVCQVGSPRSFSVGIQRIGRSGHFKGAVPKGRLFPMSRDELLECGALVRGLMKRRLDRIEIPKAPLDVLCQQMAAACAADDWPEDGLFALVRRAWPYHALARKDFDDIVHLLAEGFAPNGKAKPLVHRDGVNHVLRGRRGTRLTALTSGGAIPDQADYAVIAEPEETQIGTVNEDFIIEAQANDIFMLGTSSWRILRVENGRVRVASAEGMAGSVPFWLGEAPGRTRELSEELSLLRTEIEPRLEQPEAAAAWLAEETHMPLAGALQSVTYLAEAKAALGTLPTMTTLIAERFFDEAGGMQLVVHAPFGARLNRGFGLALRKSFCKTFDFELQAAATDDAVLLSLGPQHSFPLETIFELVHPNTIRKTLIAAAMLAPMFAVRWRWTGQRSLALLRRMGGKRIPPNIQRMRADDLLAAVFPEHAGCQENAGTNGPLTPPDHPLVNEALNDCLHEAMDLDGLTALLTAMQRGELTLLARDLPEPSVLSHEILNARPYAFLDDAPLEERRARAVQTRRSPTRGNLDALALLDAEAIAAVRAQAAPQPRDAEELHDLMLQTLWVPRSALSPAWTPWLTTLQAAGRTRELDGGFIAVEREPEAGAARAGDGAFQERMVRGWMDLLGPITAPALAELLRISEGDASIALHQIEAKGGVLRGHFSPGVTDVEWCERGLLARIHRLTLGRLRREIEPVTAAQFLRFLFAWQHVVPTSRLHGAPGLTEVLSQLQGFPVAAGAWEREVLPARIANYDPWLLDQLCLQGRVAWGRFARKAGEPEGRTRRAGPTRAAPVAFALREEVPWILALARRGEGAVALSAAAAQVRELLVRRGALFLPDIQALTGRIPTEVEQSLWELVAAGEVTGDGFGGIRSLIEPKRGARRQKSYEERRGLPHRFLPPPAPGGRWSLLDPSERSGVIAAPPEGLATEVDPALVEQLARQLLRRYGVVFRDLLVREASLPPWRELLWVYRRLEARGEVRGGRFVTGFQGEQFALPEAVESLRAVRREARPGQRVELSAADPLNLVGILTPDARVPAVLGHKVVYLDGVPQLESVESVAAVALPA